MAIYVYTMRREIYSMNPVVTRRFIQLLGEAESGDRFKIDLTKDEAMYIAEQIEREVGCWEDKP